MIRTLLATTAVAAVLALPVIAQDASSSMESSSMMDSSMMSSEMPMDASSSMMDSSMMSSEMPMDSSSMMDSSTMSSEMPMDSSSMMSSMEEPIGPFDIVTGYTQIDSDKFATRIIGQPVYDGTAADANKLGDISDIVIDESGTAQAVIIGVGGFLDIGEKQVAVAYSALTKQMAADNTERYVVETTVEDLTAAPDFVVVEQDAAGNPVAAPAADTTVSAPVADDAMATSSRAAH
jgi:hypothetical protein